MKSIETAKTTMEIRVRKINGKWYILESKNGEYPSNGYFKKATGCKTKTELQDELEIKEGCEVKLISI